MTASRNAGPINLFISKTGWPRDPNPKSTNTRTGPQNRGKTNMHKTMQPS